MPSARNRFLPFDNWPPSDQARWREVFEAPQDLLDESGACRFALPTKRDLWSRYACFLKYALAQGQLRQDQGPAACLTEELVKGYIAWLSERVGSVNLAGTARKLHRCATLLDPKRDWKWLSQISSRLERAAKPTKQTVKIVDPRKIVQAGIDLMRRAEGNPHPSIDTADVFQDGLILALLAVTALRRTVFSGLEIDENLRLVGTVWHISLPAKANSKIRAPIDIPLHPSLNRYIELWLKKYRPMFSGASMYRRLWLSRMGPLDSGQIYCVVTSRTEYAFGFPMNPHSIRHSAASMIAADFDQDPEMARAVLGHASLSTTTKHYTHGTMRPAITAYQRLVGMK
jgi:integrase